MTPGLYHGMPFADYAAAPGLSNSIAKIGLSQSWYHARQAMLGLMKREKDEFDLGTAAHSMLLEGDASGLQVIDADDWRTKAAKEAREAARAAGKTPILSAKFDLVKAMVETAQEFIARSELPGIFQLGKPEVSVFWSEDGTPCKARCDWLTDEASVILDYKTTGNAAPEAFGRSIDSFSYDLQAAWYRRGVVAVTGKLPAFVFLAQETEYPYSCSLHGLSNASLEIAEAMAARALREYRECKASSEWPGYPRRIMYHEPAAWKLNHHMAMMEGEE